MDDIHVEHDVNEERLRREGIRQWPVWTKEVSEFPWSYDEQEVCYFLEGEVEVTPEGGQPVVVKKGDLATFPKGMSCTWKITRDVRKHYTFG
jgi:uncharacterized cupin superfamily protein